VAFGTTDPLHLLNVRVGNMSALPEEPDHLLPDDSVLLIGTGLTMVDVVVSPIETRGYRGPIWAVSRRGQLPQVHAELGPTPADPPAELPRTARGRLRWVRDQASMQSDWRSTIDGLRPVTQATWHAARLDERARFLRQLQPCWDTHRHRIAPGIGRVVRDAIERGQLQVRAGRLLGLTDTCAHMRLRGGSGELVLDVKRVINCTGPAPGLQGVDDPPVRSLLDFGRAVPDRLGLGFATTDAVLVSGLGRDGLLLLRADRRSP
jgi:uncharacterized NAD(P)/FAD-binding protein YdhS